VSFASMVQADAAAICSLDEFGEILTYRPAAGGTKTIHAIVSRHPLVINEASQKQTAQKVFELVISKDADVGVATITKGTDKCDVPPARGGTPVTMRVVDVVAEGLGSWRVKVVA